MPSLHVDRNIEINAPISRVYEELNSFENWPAWSPWLILDPSASVQMADDNSSYAWTGPRVGAGNMTITNQKENEFVEYELNFLKPWKSTSRVRFEVKENGKQTVTTWKMEGSLPFFLFWMKKSMLAYIGNDYERGLNNLKAVVERGHLPSKLNFLGESQFDGCTYIGKTTDCEFDAIGEQMKVDFTNLFDQSISLTGADRKAAFTIYHKWDMVKGLASYSVGIPVDTDAETPSGYYKKVMPPTTINTIEHIGPYDFLGNAWSAAYSMVQSKEIKIRKDLHPFETYLNSPVDTKPEHLITHINFPVK